MRRVTTEPEIKPVPYLFESEKERVRFIYENPSTDYGWFYFFGVRESCARVFSRLVTIEQLQLKQGKPGSLVEVVSNFFDRTHLFRHKLKEGICVYWVVLRVTVERDDKDATLMPAIAACVFSPQGVLASTFDGLLREPDAEESKRLAYCAVSIAGVLPVATGSRAECDRARLYLETIQEGLTAGYELATPALVDKRLRRNNA